MQTGGTPASPPSGERSARGETKRASARNLWSRNHAVCKVEVYVVHANRADKAVIVYLDRGRLHHEER